MKNPSKPTREPKDQRKPWLEKLVPDFTKNKTGTSFLVPEKKIEKNGTNFLVPEKKIEKSGTTFFQTIFLNGFKGRSPGLKAYDFSFHFLADEPISAKI